MSELNIDKSKKIEWLQKFGTENALELLGFQVDALAEKAVQENLKFKEKKEMNQATTDFADPLNGFAESENESRGDVSAFEKDNTPVAIEEAIEETPVVEEEAVVTEVKSKTEDKLSEVEGQELVDVIIAEIANPLIETMTELRTSFNEQFENYDKTIKSLQDQVVVLQKELKIQELSLQEEMLPRASHKSLLKDYVNKRLNEVDGKFGKALNDSDPILERKPEENKVKSTNDDEGIFAGFAAGV